MYFGSNINESPVIAGVAGAAIEGGAFKVVKFNSGKVVLAGVPGAPVLGILPAQTPDLAEGDDVTVQVAAIGKVKAGAAVAKGALLMTDENGLAVTAVPESYIFGIALESAAASGALIDVLIKGGGYAPAAAGGST